VAANITFLGADDTVTGSRYLVETDSSRVLVDFDRTARGV
jgi:predicted metal-dependent RNase